MFDRGLMLTAQAIRRQLAAMPHELYLVRLIHQPTKRPFPGARLWTAQQLLSLAPIRFLRARNREGGRSLVPPYSQDHNAGYILVDLDRAEPTGLTAMSTQGHEPCVVLQTSPGHLQAWVHVSSTPLPPAIATAIGQQLARAYGGDRASTDWRHLGRLAGFTNQKPRPLFHTGNPPWARGFVYSAGPGKPRQRPATVRCWAGSATASNPGLCRSRSGPRSSASPTIRDHRGPSHRDLPNVDAALANCRTFRAARLEHR